MTPSSVQAHGCPCGRDHTCDVRKVLTGVGALTSLPHELAALGITKPFILCDPAGDGVSGSGAEYQRQKALTRLYIAVNRSDKLQ